MICQIANLTVTKHQPIRFASWILIRNVNRRVCQAVRAQCVAKYTGPKKQGLSLRNAMLGQEWQTANLSLSLLTTNVAIVSIMIVTLDKLGASRALLATVVCHLTD